jgi:predicted phosphodiesterase
MTITSRSGWLPAAAAVLLLSLPFLPRLSAQGARDILFEPGSVNASVGGTSWWLANGSIVVTWSTAGGGLRLASVYDRLGGRAATKPGETFTVAVSGGGTVAGSALTLTGRPSIADVPAAEPSAGSAALKAGKQISARFTSADGALAVAWRAELREGDDVVRQSVKLESGSGEPAVVDIGVSGTPRSPVPQSPAPAATILAGPYLQNPGPSSMTIMWVTEPRAAGWVEYGRDGEAPTRVLPVRDGLIEANTRVHRVTLTGLAPGTLYTYRIATRPIVSFGPYKVDYGDIARSDTHAFRTLGPARQTYSVLVLNDLHEDVDTMRAHVTREAARPFDLVFFNGDSLSHLESEAQVLDRCLKPASEAFASRVPLLLVRGNHETRGAFARELGRYLALPGGRFYYSFDHGPVHFVVLDTGEDKEDGHWAYSGLTGFDDYRQEEAEWLAQEVASRAFKQARFRVLVAHMPFFGGERTRVDGHGPADCRERWGRLLNESGLDLHIAGHTHRADWVEPAAGANSFPVSVGGGSARGSNTATRVNVTPDRLEVIVTSDAGAEVSRRTVHARR